MPIAHLIAVVRKLAGLPDADALDGLHPPDRFRRILERERARSNRTGEPLSLVAFAPRCPEADGPTPALLAGILQTRLRSTDVAGWLDDRQVGVVLPTTPAAGAWKLADDVCLEFPKHVPPPICTVYSHPNDWTDGGERVSEPAEAAAPVAAEKRTLGLELLFVQPHPAWKRALDVLGAAVCLVVLLPVFGLVAAAVKLTSPGPVLFRQWRSGRGGRPFVIYKFRTMVADAEARKAALLRLSEQDGPAFKLRNDPRITPLGRLLRSTSLDELPQLWNVLKGDMSLVGPRPLPCAEAEACVGWQRQRLDVMPGLTCIWQVWGRSRVTFAEWVRMDVQYIRSRSVWQDLKLLALTVPAVVLRKGT